MTSTPAFWIFYVILLVGMLYFMAIRPQKKEKQKMQEMLNSVAVGDTVIVEFGSNKNCRIPMQKTAIAQVEKPEA